MFDTPNERSELGLSFAVSNTCNRSHGQKLFALECALWVASHTFLAFSFQIRCPAAARQCFSLDYRRRFVDTEDESWFIRLSFAVSKNVWEASGGEIFSHVTTLQKYVVFSEKLQYFVVFDMRQLFARWSVASVWYGKWKRWSPAFICRINELSTITWAKVIQPCYNVQIVW